MPSSEASETTTDASAFATGGELRWDGERRWDTGDAVTRNAGRDKAIELAPLRAAELAHIDDLCRMMRRHGAIALKAGEIHLQLAPQAPPQVPLTPEQRDKHRRHDAYAAAGVVPPARTTQ